MKAIIVSPLNHFLFPGSRSRPLTGPGRNTRRIQRRLTMRVIASCGAAILTVLSESLHYGHQSVSAKPDLFVQEGFDTILLDGRKNITRYLYNASYGHRGGGNFNLLASFAHGGWKHDLQLHLRRLK